MDQTTILSLALHVMKPLAIPIIVVGLLGLRAHREYRVRPGRLWIAPVLLTLVIGATLYLAPHPPFENNEYIAMGLAGLSGFYFGVWQAHETVLRHDLGTGRIMASHSNAAIAVLAAAVMLRTGARELLGDGAALTSDMSLLFALGLVLALRIALWRRTRRLIPA